MSWHDQCHDFDSRVEASAEDRRFHDVTFVLTQEDAENASGDEIGANKHLIALISPVFYAQFYGPLAVDDKMPIEIVDGTAGGFKQMIDFISHPKSYQLKVADVEDVFEIAYFAHKYQIGPLVSHCRLFLGSYGTVFTTEGKKHYFEEKDALKILNKIHSNSHLETSFPAENALLVQACWKIICTKIKDFFPDGKIRNDQVFPTEELMMDILKSDLLFADESFLLTVALNYFTELIDDMEIANKKVDKLPWDSRLRPRTEKKFKIDTIHLWKEKLRKISQVIDFKKISTNKISFILHKVHDKIPAEIAASIKNKVSSGRKPKTVVKNKNRARSYDPFIDFYVDASDDDDNDDDDDSYNDTFSFIPIDKDPTVKFTINKNAIFLVNYNEWHWGEMELEAIAFQNGTDYVEIVKEEWPGGIKFFAKENTPITLTFKVLYHKEDVYMCQVKRAYFKKNDIQLKILEVNGEAVTSDNPMCYSVINLFSFQPV